MSGGNLAALHHFQYAGRERQQSNRIGEMTSALSNNLGKIALSISKFLNQLIVTSSFFNLIEVGALNIFNDGQFQRVSIGCFNNDSGHFVNCRHLSRSPSSLAGNQLEFSRVRFA